MLREGGALPRTPPGATAPGPRTETQAINHPPKRGNSSEEAGLEWTDPSLAPNPSSLRTFRLSPV